MKAICCVIFLLGSHVMIFSQSFDDLSQLAFSLNTEISLGSFTSITSMSDEENTLLFIPKLKKADINFSKNMVVMGITTMGIGSLTLLSTVIISSLTTSYDNKSTQLLYSSYNIYDFLYGMGGILTSVGASASYIGLTYKDIGTIAEYNKWKKQQRITGIISSLLGIVSTGIGIGLWSSEGSDSMTVGSRTSLLSGISLIFFGIPSIIVGTAGIL